MFAEDSFFVCFVPCFTGFGEVFLADGMHCEDAEQADFLARGRTFFRQEKQSIFLIAFSIRPLCKIW